MPDLLERCRAGPEGLDDETERSEGLSVDFFAREDRSKRQSYGLGFGEPPQTQKKLGYFERHERLIVVEVEFIKLDTHALERV